MKSESGLYGHVVQTAVELNMRTDHLPSHLPRHYPAPGLKLTRPRSKQHRLI